MKNYGMLKKASIVIGVVAALAQAWPIAIMAIVAYWYASEKLDD